MQGLDQLDLHEQRNNNFLDYPSILQFHSIHHRHMHWHQSNIDYLNNLREKDTLHMGHLTNNIIKNNKIHNTKFLVFLHKYSSPWFLQLSPTFGIFFQAKNNTPFIIWHRSNVGYQNNFRQIIIAKKKNNLPHFLYLFPWFKNESFL